MCDRSWRSNYTLCLNRLKMVSSSSFREKQLRLEAELAVGTTPVGRHHVVEGLQLKIDRRPAPSRWWRPRQRALTWRGLGRSISKSWLLRWERGSVLAIRQGMFVVNSA